MIRERVHKGTQEGFRRKQDGSMLSGIRHSGRREGESTRMKTRLESSVTSYCNSRRQLSPRLLRYSLLRFQHMIACFNLKGSPRHNHRFRDFQWPSIDSAHAQPSPPLYLIFIRAPPCTSTLIVSLLTCTWQSTESNVLDQLLAFLRL